MPRTLGVLALFLAVVAAPSLARADDDATAAPFRAKLVFNAAVAKKGASSLASIAKQGPPKGLSADERKSWAEQSKVLSASASRLAALKLRMDAILSKAHANSSELALVNLELGTAQQEIEAASQRCAVGASTKNRHEAAMKSLR